MRTALIVAVLCCLTGGMLEAQQPDRGRRTRFGLYLNSGLAIPVGGEAFGGAWRPGLTVGGSVRFRLSRGLLVDAYFEYSQFAGTTPLIDPEGVRAPRIRSGNLYAGFVDVIWHPVPRARVVSPYLLAGLGYVSSSTFGSGVSVPVGAGLLFVVARRAALFGDARYVVTPSTDLQYVTLRAGVTLR